MTTLTPGQAQSVADLGACIDLMSASVGPPGVDYTATIMAAYNKMADICGALQRLAHAFDFLTATLTAG
jgi:hypothetical protein